MKIIFWGTPKYAADNLLTLISSGHEVTAVVTQPDRKRGRGKNMSPSPVKKVAEEYDIPVFTTKSIRNDQITKDKIINLNADVYVVVAFGQILPIEILKRPKLGCWNSHASLLPEWRGAAPIQWSIINDDSKTGVCIMAMESGLDTGPVIAKESTEIDDKDNLEILTNRLSKMSSELIIKSLSKIKLTTGLNEIDRLKKLNAIEQSKLTGIPSYARQIVKEDYLIDWNHTSRKIFKKIQGLFPNAYTIFNGKRIKIFKACIIINYEDYMDSELIEKISKKKYKTGEIIMIKKESGIFIMSNDYPLIIKEGQLEGKNKTDSYTLSIQCNLKIKNCFGI
ncbi:methionyl-tRNA formyltransferase [Prochlorococcus marinus]|uniref:Methionyl-tRNA formyltransferase n=1 Tax=Prochlorococcus marinus XMU1408 TaxID=2213228 RepID=A0A318R6L3_PROMR|nr:methionyl-tRNA formyltransferase [Prochlorococcus marinus]MBW3041998.1 methionyl-tRNA formyltransferase [Prochlorococcus marinus str. XMU1408]PYE03121.1 methionyl-tRNA formyltransferase [Prochlorococcus marinus XMU1408]